MPVFSPESGHFLYLTAMLRERNMFGTRAKGLRNTSQICFAPTSNLLFSSIFFTFSEYIPNIYAFLSLKSSSNPPFFRPFSRYLGIFEKRVCHGNARFYILLPQKRAFCRKSALRETKASVKIFLFYPFSAH